jgi:hypothetical protein
MSILLKNICNSLKNLGSSTKETGGKAGEDGADGEEITYHLPPFESLKCTLERV